jgi:hypothetical protein
MIGPRQRRVADVELILGRPQTARGRRRCGLLMLLRDPVDGESPEMTDACEWWGGGGIERVEVGGCG